jgi:hypothetical protein
LITGDEEKSELNTAPSGLPGACWPVRATVRTVAARASAATRGIVAINPNASAMLRLVMLHAVLA